MVPLLNSLAEHTAQSAAEPSDPDDGVLILMQDVVQSAFAASSLVGTSRTALGQAARASGIVLTSAGRSGNVESAEIALLGYAEKLADGFDKMVRQVGRLSRRVKNFEALDASQIRKLAGEIRLAVDDLRGRVVEVDGLHGVVEASLGPEYRARDTAQNALEGHAL